MTYEILTSWAITIVSAGLVGISGVVPLLLIPYDTVDFLSSKDGRNYMNWFLSFAVGSILGDVFVHLLPETFELYRNYSIAHNAWIGIIIIFCILLFLVIEKLCTTSVEVETESEEKEKLHESKQNRHPRFNGTAALRQRRREKSKEASKPKKVPEDSKAINVEGYLNLTANVVDNFSHGLAVGGSFSVSMQVGLLTTLCILIHEVPHEMSDFVILLRAGFDKQRAARAQLATASSCIVGAAFALVVDSATAGYSKAFFLPFTCGGFIYIALVTLVPNLTKEEDPGESLKQLCLILLGLAITSFLTMCHF